MINQTTCPVCNKTGIPDFYAEDVVCPCCGSDLSTYRKLKEISSQKRSKTNILSWAIGIIALLACIAVVWLGMELSSRNKKILAQEQQAVSYQNQISVLKDSISSINIVLPEKKIEDIQTEWYIVRPGDSFCRISKNIYGTEAKYKEIAALNHIGINAILHVGDSIRIK